MRILVLTGVVAALAVLIAAAPATASGPAAPGKELVDLNCEGLGAITVSVAPGEGNSVGQIVGATGHGIPVSFTFAVTDVTTGTLLFSDSESTGNGHAHLNQSTVNCTFVEFEGAASDVFGDELPPGVDPTDVVRVGGTVAVILKP